MNRRLLNEIFKGTISLPKSRAEAKCIGVKQYFTGESCKYGHIDIRYVAGGGCASCIAIRAKQKWDAGIRQDQTNRPEINKRWNGSSKGYVAKQQWKERDPKRAWAVYATGGAKSRSKVSDLEFNLDYKYILSITPDICPVFGTKFIFINNKYITPESATLDRLEPYKGYTVGNVVVVSMKANSIKNAYGSEDILTVGNWLKELGY